MQKYSFVLIASFCLFGFVLTAAAQNQNRIFGRITTVDGEEFTGLIRWDKNEATWVDILNGSKEISKENIREARRQLREKSPEKSFWSIPFGRKRSSRDWPDASLSGIRFGHLAALEPTGRNRARLTLKSGDTIEFMNGSTDIGTDNRGIVIEDDRDGEIRFGWRDISRVEFMDSKSDQQSRFGESLYGTLTTRHGYSFTGLVCWDVDEAFTTDVLDGSERGRKRKVRFADIVWIERHSSRSAALMLKSGAELVLRGSNDVDEGNRGIIVSDPGFGQVMVKWDDFKRLEFQPVQSSFSFTDFDGGKRIRGTVYSSQGEAFTGTVRWDNDEAFTWELLNGELDKMVFDIEFGKIKMIQKESSDAARITLSDGRELLLTSSNDVNEGNRGIFIQTAGGEIFVVDWDDFDRAVFER